MRPSVARPYRLVSVLLVGLAACAAPQPPQEAATEPAPAPAELEIAFVAPDEEYRQQIATWRQGREQRLRSENGWLTLVGLFWLEPGDNRFGSDSANELVFPPPAPLRAGTLSYEAGAVRLIAEPGVQLTIDGEPVADRVLEDSSAAAPDLVRLGRLNFHVIERSGRHAVRLKDPESPTRVEFEGLDYYPLDAAFALEARLQAYPEPREVSVATVIESEAKMYSPGMLEFRLGGQTFELEALTYTPDQPEELFLIFKDRTSGPETYGAGRYLYAPVEGDVVLLDFNKAYNPPCVFTPFATCPLPPPSNDLPFAVRAGEKNYSGHSPGS